MLLARYYSLAHDFYREVRKYGSSYAVYRSEYGPAGPPVATFDHMPDYLEVMTAVP